MQTLIMVEPGSQILRQATDVVELRDDQGKFLGFFSPALGARPKINLTREQVQARSQGPGKTIKEILEHLLTLATAEKDRGLLQKQIAELAARDACATP